MIDYAVRRLHEEMTPELAELLSPEATLVPMPRNAPFPPKADSVLWVPLRICTALLAEGLGVRILTSLERTEAVQKSAFAGLGGRPSAQRHYETLRATPEVAPPAHVVVVDDVITKGATAIAAVSRVREMMPDADVRVFALVRTCGLVPEIDRIIEPILGTVSWDRWRRPVRDP
jgi:predicted amidophosphoribosyltransferase